jgi:4-amino-4-deoxy-L-arabinose transferase-like glycosyltransferase
MKYQKYIHILLGIILVAISLRCYCFRGFVGLDDAEYSKIAYQIVQGQYKTGVYQGPAVFPLRVGIIYPTVLSFRIFGVTEWGMILYPMFLSVLSLLLCYGCGAMFFGRTAGLIAAAFWAVLPADIEYNATILLPDLPAAFFASLAIVGIVLLRRRERLNRYLLFLGGLLAGLSFGISWLCKESLAFFLPFCLILLFIGFREDRGKTAVLWSGVVVGSLGVLLLEMVAYRNVTGDWLFRFHEFDRNYRQWSNGLFTEGSKFGWGVGESHLKAVVKRIFLAGPRTIFLNSQFLFLPLIGLLASAYAIYRRDRAFLIPSLWLLTLCFMFNFSTSSFSSYTPLALYERYLYPIYLPAIVITAGFLVRLLFRESPETLGEVGRERLFWGVTLALMLSTIGGYHACQMIRGNGMAKAWMSEVRQASRLVPPGRVIYTDTIGKKGLEFFRQYADPERIVDFEGMSTSQVAHGSFVLTNLRYTEWLDINAGMWLSGPSGYRKPEYFSQVPSSWNVVFRTADGTLYSVP